MCISQKGFYIFKGTAVSIFRLRLLEQSTGFLALNYFIFSPFLC
jgi:hypothetical protein